MKNEERGADHPYVLRHSPFPIPICRLGLATRGDTGLTVDDIHAALDRGVNFLNWCNYPDALQQAVAGLGTRRRDIAVCVQFEARTTQDAKHELRKILHDLNTDYLDVLTFYYVEEAAEWDQLRGPDGALEFCRQAQRDGLVRLLGATSHQRPLARAMAQSRELDLLMIRYNAAHRGAEQKVFPVTDALGIPVVCYTCLRWGALLQPTSDDPPGFVVPKAPAWYRFVLQHPSVTVALMAPHDRAQLEEDLTVLEASGNLPDEEYKLLTRHGERVYRHAGSFP
jgi:predicted aldo/keto reductase-like oxidoreductase